MTYFLEKNNLEDLQIIYTSEIKYSKFMIFSNIYAPYK